MSRLALHTQSSREPLSDSSSSSTGDVAGLLAKENQRLAQSVTWQRRSQAIDQVIDAYRSCSRQDWDGRGAVPLSRTACIEAIRFLQNVSIFYPIPEIVPNSDGDISLEWYRRPHYLFAVTFAGIGKIYFAGLFGKGNRQHGSEIFGDSVPASVFECMTRLYAQG